MNTSQDAVVPSPPPIVATEPAKPRGHLPHVDGLRASCALLVIINHAFQQIYWKDRGGALSGRVGQWFSLGHYAVVAFIVVSGFCLMLPVIARGGLKDGVWGFYKARAWRIVPAYWAAVAVTLILIAVAIGHRVGAMYDLSLPITKSGVVGHLLLINNLWPRPFFHEYGNMQIASVYWSVALESQIYLLFPLFVRMWRRYGIFAPLLSGGLVFTLLRLLTDGKERFGINWSGFHWHFYLFFLLGMLAACIVYEGPRTGRLDRLPWRGLAIAMLLGWIACYASMLVYQFPNVTELELYTAITTLAILVAGTQGGVRFLAWTPLARVGLYSYSIYLLHLPLLALVTDLVILRCPWMPPARQFLLLLVLSVPLTLFCSKWFARLFEDRKALQRLLGRIFGRTV